MKKNIATTFALITGILAAGFIYRSSNKKLKKEKELNRKNDKILALYSQWTQLRQEGKTIASYLKEQGYNSVAIYGMHYLGQDLLQELKNSGIEVKYAIDRNAEKIDSDVDLYTIDESLPEVDAIIVTAFYFFDDIEDVLVEKVSCPILSIEDIMYEL